MIIRPTDPARFRTFQIHLNITYALSLRVRARQSLLWSTHRGSSSGSLQSPQLFGHASSMYEGFASHSPWLARSPHSGLLSMQHSPQLRAHDVNMYPGFSSHSPLSAQKAHCSWLSLHVCAAENHTTARPD